MTAEHVSGDEPEVVGHRAVPAPVTPNRTTDGLDTDYAAVEREQIEVRYRPGSYAERVAPDVLRRAVRARQRLRGFGSEPWGSTIVIQLVEPFADADGRLIDRGTIVDAARRRISFVVTTPESPIEDPHRALAVVFGSAFPSAERNASLIEAYGLHLSGADTAAGSRAGEAGREPDDGRDDRLDDELAFVRFLIEAEGDDVLRRYLAAEPEREAALCRQLYGAPLQRLRENWRRSSGSDGAQRVRIRDFVRMSARFLRPYRLRQLELFLHMLLGLSFTLAFPLVTQRLFDGAIPSGNFRQVANLLMVLGAAFVVSLVADVRRSYLHAWIGGAVSRDLRQQLYDRLQLVPVRWHRRHDQGDVLTRLFNDVSQVQGALTEVLTLGLFQAISVLVSAAVMFSLNWVLGTVVVVGVPVIAVVFTLLAGGAVERSKDVQASQSALMSVAAENVRAANVVRLFGLSSHESRRFGHRAARLFGAQQRLNMWMGLFGLSINLILRILRLVALGLGAWLILEGDFTVGGLVAFLAIMGEVLNPITDLANIGQSIQGSMGSLLQINAVLAEDVEPAGDGLTEAPALTGAIELVDVAFGYGPDDRALDGVSCTIPVGARVAFVGPSGSGKSTVLRLLMRLDEPESGAIVVDGVDLRGVSVASWRNQLGVVFQDSFLFDATIRENIAVGAPGIDEDGITQAVRLAGLEAVVAELPAGLDTPVGQDGTGLSGGQRQRVAIARALARRPPVLLLDEATSALDAATEHQINETLLAAAAGRTVVSVTHRLAALPAYDLIMVMDRGIIVEQGSHDELLAAGGLYARLWAQQMGGGSEPPDDPAGSRADCRAALAELPLFADLTPDQLDEIVASMSPRTLEPGERTASEQELLVLLAGEADVWIGSPAAAVTLGPGDVIGLRSVLGSPATTMIEPATEVEALVLPAAVLDTFEARFSAVAAARAGQTGQLRPSGTVLTGTVRTGPGLIGTVRPPGGVSPRPDREVTPRVEAVGDGRGARRRQRRGTGHRD